MALELEIILDTLHMLLSLGCRKSPFSMADTSHLKLLLSHAMHSRMALLHNLHDYKALRCPAPGQASFLLGPHPGN